MDKAPLQKCEGALLLGKRKPPCAWLESYSVGG